MAQLIMRGLHTVTGHKQNVLAQRPFFVWWFMGQMARYLSSSKRLALDMLTLFKVVKIVAMRQHAR